MVESLHKGRDFSDVYDAKRSRANRHLAMYVRENGRDHNRIGIVASKKLGNSVVRHRVKRLIKESLRTNGDKFSNGLDIIVIARRECVGKTQAEVRDKLAAEMRWYDKYLLDAQVDRSANPTPGNKKGGLANIVEKAMGSIAKSGTSPIVEVLSPAEKPTEHGLIFAATPASDIVCGPCQVASGIGLQVFMTGRGTPYNLAAVPVIKVCSRNDLKEQWPDIIDISAGDVATGEKTIAEVGTEIFNKIIACASGKAAPGRSTSFSCCTWYAS